MPVPGGAEGAHFAQAIQLVSALVAADLAEQVGQAPIQPGMPGTIVMHGLTQLWVPKTYATWRYS